MSTHSAPMPRATGKALERWLRRQAGEARLPLAAAVCAGALGGIVLIAQSWVLARIIDAVVVGRHDLRAVEPWLVALLAIFVLRAIAALISESMAFEAGARIVRAVRAKLQSHVTALGPSWTRLARTGEVAGTLFDSVESIGRYYTTYLPQSALVAFVPLAILAFVIPTDWVSGLIMTLSAPLVPLFMILIGKGTEALNQSQWRILARMSGHVFDAIEGLTTLKLFNASRAEIQAVAEMSDNYRVATMAVLRVAFLSSLVLEFIATISIAMVAVYIGFRLYYGEMHLLPGLAVLLIAPEFYRVLRAMGTQYHARMEAIGAAQAIVALLETEPPRAPGHGVSLPRGTVTTVRFEQIGFSYGATPILRGINLTLARGRCIALVGPSGSGKTTLAELLLGFVPPSHGRLTADGVDLDLLSPAEWRRRIVWLPQRPTLFHGSVLDNIRLGWPDADPQSVRRAVEQAGADDLIARLANGYDTLLGDRGQGLSGGEIQRIALARVFLKQADIMILDEPTAGLDAELAARVARSIQALSATRATLVIAHDETMVQHADEVMVLEGGRLVAPRVLA
ncbi:thiol reductant ABC exporter subunit CydD [Lichenicoccus sp.]|uniref:thiol reductant ABC exporter subunit CydD n=1 Tax=Lichenicoccus sp. TaxID=2781899 RepID=UPI003D0B6506